MFHIIHWGTLQKFHFKKKALITHFFCLLGNHLICSLPLHPLERKSDIQNDWRFIHSLLPNAHCNYNAHIVWNLRLISKLNYQCSCEQRNAKIKCICTEITELLFFVLLFTAVIRPFVQITLSRPLNDKAGVFCFRISAFPNDWSYASFHSKRIWA